ncbi:hypothetical protein GCM10007160_21950 [Litchfieldella qijiaojingensis]|uniref:Uncharacterized protein n=1 Tax=Litchfieldella qijiaojingensis TaxID=980347 RepID=A0ABQ2YVL1_9GAMM|nr:hypothetical protein [Halomonas qijiaojingensis]GGX94052.1 hypothetical protein GCM10007160_21950 [Halomonas qijiaojingensis]
MDTRDSKSREEEKRHVIGQRMPEDYEHPEPDEEQPEAQSPPTRLHRILPIIIVLVLVAGLAFHYLGR